MIKILQYLKDPKLWELWYAPGVTQDLDHPPYQADLVWVLKLRVLFIRVPYYIWDLRRNPNFEN